jgi:putative protein-disulfide isomerase
VEQSVTDRDEELIYGFDPLCGWCFAFGPSYQAIRAAHPDLPVTMRYGGLVLGERVGPIADHRDYLTRGLEQVRQTAGVAAGEAFLHGLLAEGSYVSNSEPPCRAIWAMEQLAPAGAADFAAALPDIHYIDGQPLDDPAVLGALAERHGADREAFVALWQSDAAREGVQRAFAEARTFGISSYPTVLYRRDDKLYMVAQGFAPPELAASRVARAREL